MTVINSDGTTTTYTASGKLLDGEQQRPSEATKAVTDSDRVTAKGSVNVRSKKTERMKRKLEKKKAKSAGHQPTHLLDLPNEILFNIFIQMRPSEVLGTLHICRAFHDLVQHNEALLSRHIVSARYP
ncbi:hypothetical protein CH063_06538, partial [Colletotrichum higginsianum]